MDQRSRVDSLKTVRPVTDYQPPRGSGYAPETGILLVWPGRPDKTGT